MSQETGYKRLNCTDEFVSHTEGNENKKGITSLFEGDHLIYLLIFETLYACSCMQERGR